jgi:signal transduction histidine kinase
MFIVPKASVRVNLAIAILLTVVLSWILSTGITNYFNYLSLRALHQQMISHPNIYSRPIPQPRFGIMEFLTGRSPLPPDRPPPQSPGSEPGGPPPGFEPGPPPSGGPETAPPEGTNPGPGPADGQMGGPPLLPPDRAELRMLLLRFVVALGMASLAGVWLGRRFTRPLTQLAKGADAFQSGNLGYRIPTGGRNEFAAVANAMNEMARQVSIHISKLEDDAERRRQFLADIAHELRSPVTTMRTMAGALQDGVAGDPQRTQRAVSALVRTSERLLRLVLELAKLDLNELPLSIKRVDLRELAESVVHSRESEAASAGITLHPVVSPHAVMALLDPDRMTQVIDNVLDNAISYAGEGAEVSVVLQDGDPIMITTSDTGKGIAPDDLPRISDSFYRADAARTPGDFHFGLGLSIARRLVEAHGGSLTVSSEEGKGTTVEIAIPRT